MELKRRHKVVGNIVSLYAGAGGMDIGFHNAGFNIQWSNELSLNAVNTYRELFKSHKCTRGNLCDQVLPEVENLDLVIGGPPCQGFSVAGKMDPNDPRSMHVWNFLGVVSKLNPRGFVMENVKALAVNSRWKGLVEDLKKEANKLGYRTTLVVLNASHYGVPQARERMFLIGLKDGEFKIPKPTTKEHPITVRQAFHQLPKFGEEGNNSICTAKVTPARNPIMRKSPYAGMLFNGQGRPINLEAPALTLPASMGGNRTPIIDQKALELSEVPWVKKYHERLVAGGESSSNAPEYLRRITVEEAAVLQTFPIGMTFYGPQTSKFRQIGNAVPPQLAYHVALAVRNALYPETESKVEEPKLKYESALA
jgi:DNA (cytosine-5)-methyltransferase 1